MKDTQQPVKTVKTQHTPGPWNINTIGDIWSPSGLVAKIELPKYTDSEADAKLIAAAPELLEAATRVFYALEGTEQALLRNILSAAIDRATT